MYKRLKELRTENNYSQSQIADLLHIKQNTYSQYETGKRQPSVELLAKIAKIFSVSVDYILELTDSEDPYP